MKLTLNFNSIINPSILTYMAPVPQILTCNNYEYACLKGSVWTGVCHVLSSDRNSGIQMVLIYCNYVNQNRP